VPDGNGIGCVATTLAPRLYGCLSRWSSGRARSAVLWCFLQAGPHDGGHAVAGLCLDPLRLSNACDVAKPSLDCRYIGRMI
jgi:hypothetical protein